MTSTAVVERLGVEVGEVIARHDRARDISDFLKFEDDSGGFFQDVLRCAPWAKQHEMAELVRDNPRTVVVTANGLGKDWITARMALWWVFARRGLVILTGPTERQVKQILMREVRRAFARAPELPGELYSMELRVDEQGEAGVLAFTSDNADRLTGFHHPRLLICVTEGQGVSEDAYEALQACATGPENRVFVYGNPTRPTGPFYRVAHSGNWARLRIAASEHPNVISGCEEIPGAVSREWIESMREEYGVGSSIYRSRVLAEFPEDSIEGLIRRDWLRAAFKRHETGALTDAAAWVTPILALDPARYGPDESVLAVVRGPIVQELVSWRGASTVETVERTIEHANRVRATAPRGRSPMIYVDEPGLGGGVVDLLKAKGWNTHGFNGASRPADETRFANARSHSHWILRTLLEEGKVALPRDPLLEEEALAIEWALNHAGKIQILSKDLIRGQLGRSPDRLDAVVIGLAHSMGHMRRNTGSVQTIYM